jgi:hypothetical protein
MRVETWPAMALMVSLPGPLSANSVMSVWRLSCQGPALLLMTFALGAQDHSQKSAHSQKNQCERHDQIGISASDGKSGKRGEPHKHWQKPAFLLFYWNCENAVAVDRVQSEPLSGKFPGNRE